MTIEFGPEAAGERPAVAALMATNSWEDDRLDFGEVWVARDDGEVIGVVHGVPVEPGTYYVESALLREDRRGAGIGADLFRALHATHSGEVILACHDNRIPFYERLGYEVIDASDLAQPVRDHPYLVQDLPSRPDHVHHLMRRMA